MKVHKVKIYESYADAVLSGEKTFEIRNNDRGYQKGDRLRFHVVEDGCTAFNKLNHGLNNAEYEITYVHSGLGMKEGYVALAIKAAKNEERRCNQCAFYKGVHNVQGHAPCSKLGIPGVLWNDTCDQFKAAKEVEEEVKG